MARLPAETQTMMQLAACIGSQFTSTCWRKLREADLCRDPLPVAGAA